jgi:hypothetical protein
MVPFHFDYDLEEIVQMAGVGPLSLKSALTVALCWLRKSSEFGAILWLFCPEARVAELRNWLPRRGG